MPGLPDRIGEYDIESLLGRGGMGCVYLARDRSTHEQVALKVLAAGLGEDESAVKRFGQELDALSRLDHRGITRALSSMMEDDGHLYFALEYVPGETLAERLRRDGPLPAGTAVALGMKLFEALSAAHSLGIVHRDIKPSNVLLPDDGGPAELKVADFGLARLADVTRLTSTGQLMGTLSYMSPEQCEGSTDLDEKVDLYAAGIVLFEMLAGSPPFRSDTPAALLRAHMLARPPRLDRIRGDVPPTLVELINRCLAKDPKDRIASAADGARILMQLPLLEDTTDIVGTVPERMVIPKAPDTVVPGVVRKRKPQGPFGQGPLVTVTPSRKKKRSNLFVAIVLVVAVAAAAAGAAAFLRSKPGPDDRETVPVDGVDADATECLRTVRQALEAKDHARFIGRCTNEFVAEFLAGTNSAIQFESRLGAADASDFTVEGMKPHFGEGSVSARILGSALPAALGLDPPTGPVSVALERGTDGRWRIEALLGRGNRPDAGKRIPAQRVQQLARKGQLVRRVFALATQSIEDPAERKAWQSFVDQHAQGGDTAANSVSSGHPRYDAANRMWTLELRISGLPGGLSADYNGLLVELRAQTQLSRSGRSVERLRPEKATLTWLER